MDLLLLQDTGFQYPLQLQALLNELASCLLPPSSRRRQNPSFLLPTAYFPFPDSLLLFPRACLMILFDLEKDSRPKSIQINAKTRLLPSFLRTFPPVPIDTQIRLVKLATIRVSFGLVVDVGSSGPEYVKEERRVRSATRRKSDEPKSQSNLKKTSRESGPGSTER